jgi:anaerobic selenocysteine-containing dehydrogenase
VQITFHPDRIRQPLKRSGSRGDGRFDEVEWDAALTEVVAQLDRLAASGSQRSLAFLTRPRSGRRQALVEEFLQRFGAPPPVAFELFDDEVLRRANGLSFGREQLPTFDLARSRYVLSFGADFLSTWNSPVAHATAYGQMRRGRPGIRGSFVQVEPRMTQTGANADEWIPAASGTEGVLALGLAHVILREKLKPSDPAVRVGSLIDGWSAGLLNYAPEQVEKITGVSVSRIERLARELASMTPSVALIGGAPLAHTNGLFNALAVNALNALIGAVEQPGGMFFTPQVSRLTAARGQQNAPAVRRTISTLATEVLAGGESPIQLLFVDDANPVFATPKGWRVREALDKIPFIVSFGNFLDETSVLADLILPDHSFLESWVDSAPESGSTLAVAGVAPPAMRPLHQTRSAPDVLMDLGRRLAKPIELPWQTYDEMLQMWFAQLPAAAGDDDPWASAQVRGGWWGDLPPGAATAAPTPARPARTFTFAVPRFDGDAAEYPFQLLPCPTAAFFDGSLAHLPWLQELPDPLTSAMWSSWIEINPEAAQKMGVSDRDIVEVTSPHGSVRVAAILSPGIAPGLVAMPVGQGHQTFTRYASGRGENPIGLLAPVVEPETGALAWAATRVRVSRVGGPDGRLILFAGAMREREELQR